MDKGPLIIHLVVALIGLLLLTFGFIEDVRTATVMGYGVLLGGIVSAIISEVWL